MNRNKSVAVALKEAKRIRLRKMAYGGCAGYDDGGEVGDTSSSIDHENDPVDAGSGNAMPEETAASGKTNPSAPSNNPSKPGKNGDLNMGPAPQIGLITPLGMSEGGDVVEMAAARRRAKNSKKNLGIADYIRKRMGG